MRVVHVHGRYFNGRQPSGLNKLNLNISNCRMSLLLLEGDGGGGAYAQDKNTSARLCTKSAGGRLCTKRAYLQDTMHVVIYKKNFPYISVECVDGSLRHSTDCFQYPVCSLL